MQVIDQVPPDPEKWFCTPSCKATGSYFMHMHLQSGSYIYMSNEAKSEDTGSTLSCLLYLVLLMTLISIQFGITSTKNALLFSFLSYLY